MWREGKFGVLVVDDEPSVLVTYRLILEKRGFAVRVAKTSVEAIELVNELEFDLLLCDYSLEQEHTGFEVIEAGRARKPDVMAVLLTGYASKETVEKARAANIHVLFKPIDIEEFFRTLEKLKRGEDAQTGQGEGHESDQGDSGKQDKAAGEGGTAAVRKKC